MATNMTPAQMIGSFKSAIENIVFSFLDDGNWEDMFNQIATFNNVYFEACATGKVEGADINITFANLDDRIKTRNTIRRIEADALHFAAYGRYDAESDEYYCDDRGMYFYNWSAEDGEPYDPSKA